jgi:UDP-N-acetylglucosamine 2-epimerase
LAKVIFGDTDIKQVLACLTLTQKEAYFAKVPCITLDTVTAWPETVEDGWNMVVGKENDRQQIQRENIIDAVSLLSQMKNNLIYLVTGRQQK